MKSIHKKLEKKTLYSYICILTILILVSCKTEKVLYGTFREDPLMKEIKTESKRLLLLQSLYMNDKINIIQNDSIIFDKHITSKWGWGDNVIVNKSSDIYIYILMTRKTLLL